jgi:hypothetical protein
MIQVVMTTARSAAHAAAGFPQFLAWVNDSPPICQIGDALFARRQCHNS